MKHGTERFLLPSRYHDALLGWQQLHFPDFDLLNRHWRKYFPDAAPYALCVKLSAPSADKIEVGIYAGRNKLTRAGEMKGNMLYSALRIIKAQCSTELGSIQQHTDSVDAIDDDYYRFSVLRIMAEEFRHAYQMFWVLSNDASWSVGGVHRLGDTVLDELLAMDTGTHVLDAFNIPFADPLDNMVFAALIDRVGRFQLSMQRVFAYAPMAYSMDPMLGEEHFHLRTGVAMLIETTRRAARGDGPWSIDEIQKRINAWYPRGLEMFGNPESGETNVAFGFKDQVNRDAVSAYMRESAVLVQRLNRVIEAEINGPRASERSGDGYLHLPDPHFFRIRSPAEATHRPIDVHGVRRALPEFLQHVTEVLPAGLLKSEFFRGYRDALMRAEGLRSREGA